VTAVPIPAIIALSIIKFNPITAVTTVIPSSPSLCSSLLCRHAGNLVIRCIETALGIGLGMGWDGHMVRVKIRVRVRVMFAITRSFALPACTHSLA